VILSILSFSTVKTSYVAESKIFASLKRM